MHTKLKFVSCISVFSALLIMAPASKASIINYNFNGLVESGALAGESYSGSFAFDDASLTNLGLESINLSAFSFNFLTASYNLTDADFQSTVDFFDGLFLGVSYSASGFDPSFALVSAAGLALPDDVPYFSYQTVSGNSGFGSLSFSTATAVPLPSAVWLFGSALGALVAKRRRKTQGIAN
ncbi:hypothetical protein MGMO_104c00040 [Methyloglobulus morosus KoM1]|uniref:Uncharacterized protein n=1 Tax=Methyloglobulus morosus KoM1 TaxID=1116472 RepID=V5BDP6_9GAMM|nr:VPLPA-CTERM sorting domain-containing protein [Methyloglobulus morosus]ESS71425.1 hypothetical protein MGMO_104c00040 [Methyloglobulus morosus KoM1]